MRGESTSEAPATSSAPRCPRECPRPGDVYGTYSIAKAHNQLGYEPRVDLPDGMERTRAWLADRGLP